jgi:D-alanine-D-alanine ligase-like ATP-grasp enzyme
MTTNKKTPKKAARAKKPVSIVGDMLKKVAPRIGATVVLEPNWQLVGQITFKSGRRSYFRYSSIDLNTLGASEIAKDKDYSNFFMKKMGYSTIRGKTFFSNSWAKAIASNRTIDAGWEYARKKLGLPVIVKPNSGTQGQGVVLAHTKREFYGAMRQVFKRDRVALVQKPVRGKDYRVVVLDTRVISAYQRIPLNVTGDGRATVMQLLKRKQREFAKKDRDTSIKLDDPRMAAKLRHAGMTMKSVPKKDELVYLLDNANLSTGGDSIDVTSAMHQDYKDLAVRLTRDMGLRLCGVDLMIETDISAPLGKHWILEINSAPGLDHYAKGGKAQQHIVEDLYAEVLKSLDKPL